jgi:ABC-type dipeptide/oligopeptide/nickel transport system permease component
VTMTAAMSGVALPSFLVAPILILIFSYWANILPPALWEGPEYYILPVITLGIRPAAIIARLTRSSVLDVIHSDYIRTARAKGVDHKMVLFKHVLRNSLLPVITVAGPLIATTLSGAFVIELIFAVPGAGKHFVESVTNRDYPVILGATIVFATLLVLANLVVDLLYTIVDPRIRLS